MAHDRLSFVHLSDLHILPEGESFLEQDTMQKARDVVSAISALELRPAFVVISGDLSHRGDPASYSRLSGLLDDMRALDLPVLVCLGNHDTRVAFRTEILGESNPREDQPYYYSQLIDGLRVIMLDSKVPGAHDGALDDEQLTWLAEQLAEPAPRGSLLVFHHPPVETAVPWLAGHGLRNHEQLAEVISGSDVVGILAGHIHFSAVRSFAGVTTAAAAGVAFTLDPIAQQGLRFLNGSGFNLGHIEGGALVVNPVLMPGTQSEVCYYRVGEPDSEALLARLR